LNERRGNAIDPVPRRSGYSGGKRETAARLSASPDAGAEVWLGSARGGYSRPISIAA
jgi:hypothetical protein